MYSLIYCTYITSTKLWASFPIINPDRERMTKTMTSEFFKIILRNPPKRIIEHMSIVKCSLAKLYSADFPQSKSGCLPSFFTQKEEFVFDIVVSVLTRWIHMWALTDTCCHRLTCYNRQREENETHQDPMHPHFYLRLYPTQDGSADPLATGHTSSSKNLL